MSWWVGLCAAISSPILADMEEEIDESHTSILDKANPRFYFYAVAIVFFTLLVPRYVIYGYIYRLHSLMFCLPQLAYSDAMELRASSFRCISLL